MSVKTDYAVGQNLTAIKHIPAEFSVPSIRDSLIWQCSQHTAHYGLILTGQQQRTDTVLAYWQQIKVNSSLHLSTDNQGPKILWSQLLHGGVPGETCRCM